MVDVTHTERALPTRRLGTSELQITPVGIGTAPIGSTPEWRIYWGPQREGEAVRAIETALDVGVNWIDTAPFYGWGRAEQIVGRAIHGKRDRVYVFTKCGTLRADDGGWFDDLSPASMRREVESSLRNLGTDYVDLYQLHDPDPATPIEASWATMQDLIAEGKVRYGGLSNHPIELIERAAAVGPVVATQYQYNLLERSIERDVLPYAARHEIGVLAWSPLTSGFLTDDFDLESLDPDDFRRRHRFAQEPMKSHVMAVRAKLQAIARGADRSLVALAIAWLLAQPGLNGAIVGVRNEREARAMTDALDWPLTPDELEAVETAVHGTSGT